MLSNAMLAIYDRDYPSNSSAQAQSKACTSVASSVQEVVDEVLARQKCDDIKGASDSFEKFLDFNGPTPGHTADRGTQTYIHWRVRVGPRVAMDRTCLAWVINLNSTV